MGHGEPGPVSYTHLDVYKRQRLIRAAMDRLSYGGVLYFSNNYRRFRLDEAAMAGFAHVEDISASTIPPDFSRNPSIHRAWRITAGRE